MRYNCYFNWCKKTVHCELEDRHIWVKLVRPDQTYGQQVLPLPPVEPKLFLESPPLPTNNLQQEDAKMEQPSPKQVTIPKITKRLTAGKEQWIWVPKVQTQTKSTTHTVASSKNKPPRTNQKFAAPREKRNGFGRQNLNLRNNPRLTRQISAKNKTRSLQRKR